MNARGSDFRNPDLQKRLRILCAAASQEYDPQVLMERVEEICELLDRITPPAPKPLPAA
jgi:hypothetical protein